MVFPIRLVGPVGRFRPRSVCTLEEPCRSRQWRFGCQRPKQQSLAQQSGFNSSEAGRGRATANRVSTGWISRGQTCRPPVLLGANVQVRPVRKRHCGWSMARETQGTTRQRLQNAYGAAGHSPLEPLKLRPQHGGIRQAPRRQQGFSASGFQINLRKTMGMSSTILEIRYRRWGP